MERVNKAVLISFFCLSVCLCRAQDVPLKTEQQLESLASVTESEDETDDSFLQQLTYYRKHPLNLNTATENDLQQLRFLTDLQIQNFIKYRVYLGKLIHLYELQAVPSWDVPTIERLLPFITLTEAATLKQNIAARLKGGEHTLMLRVSRILEQAKGFDTSITNHYLGDRNRLLLRYRYQYKNNLFWGLVADKDAGEPFFKSGAQTGFDFYSFHLFARRIGKIKALALGDYVVNLGQGLVQWQSLAFGKSADAMAIKRQSEVIVPYRSAGEVLFNRGAAITLEQKHWELTAFASYKNISGNLSDSGSFSSLQTSGLYRNASELADRNKIHHLSWGGNISYKSASLKLGGSFVYNRFSLPLIRRPAPYNAFAFNGKELWNSSVDYAYTFKNMHVFGEWAISQGVHTALVSGAMISASPKMDLALLYRDIGYQYQTLYGNAFTEGSVPVNEQGAYFGIVLRPAKGWQITSYADLYSFPWLRYRVDAPSNGSDYLVHIDYQPTKQSGVYAQFRSKSLSLNKKGTITDYPVVYPRQNIRLHFTTQLNKSFVLKSRAEMLWYDRGGSEAEEGFLVFAEGSYKKSRLKTNLRLQYFETGGYNSRLYAYESDVLYSVSIPAFFDKGFRYYINVEYEAGRKLTVWLRWAQTILKNKEVIGSGLDEIRGNIRSEVKAQVLYSF